MAPAARRLRLDLLLVERGFFGTRAKAQAAVMAGQVLVNSAKAGKPGTSTLENAALEILAPCPYVSRGGLKLEAALKAFGISAMDRVCLDVGASTGGFTDCLLQSGASRIYAVDVGHGQLDAKLRADPRVLSREKIHARDLKPTDFDPRPNLATIDVSFISLTRVLGPTLACLQKPWEAVALVKPQFELGPKLAPKGVVRDPTARIQAVDKVRSCLAEAGSREKGFFESPVHGPKGNVEFFLHLKPIISP